MYCLGCDYDLSGLAAGPCPECGRRFDPADVSSIGDEPGAGRRGRWAKRLEIGVVAAGAVPLVAGVFAHATLALARVSLGHWPSRAFWDNATSTGLMDVMGGVSAILWLLSIPALFVMLIKIPILAGHGAPRRLARGAVIGVGMWALGFALILWDPARAWVWIFD